MNWGSDLSEMKNYQQNGYQMCHDYII